MSAKYKEFSGLNLPAIEQEILAKWKSGQAFEQSVSLREGKKPFVFYEGPPSANGMPGIHHVISRYRDRWKWFYCFWCETGKQRLFSP